MFTEIHENYNGNFNHTVISWELTNDGTPNPFQLKITDFFDINTIRLNIFHFIALISNDNIIKPNIRYTGSGPTWIQKGINFPI